MVCVLLISVKLSCTISILIRLDRNTETKLNYYEIETQDVYKDLWTDRDKFDNSDYPEDIKFYDATNKKRIGCFKDEASGQIIKEFIDLRSKMYSYFIESGTNNKTAKEGGIKKIVIKKDIQHEDYKNTLFNNKQM